MVAGSLEAHYMLKEYGILYGASYDDLIPLSIITMHSFNVLAGPISIHVVTVCMKSPIIVVFFSFSFVRSEN